MDSLDRQSERKPVYLNHIPKHSEKALSVLYRFTGSSRRHRGNGQCRQPMRYCAYLILHALAVNPKAKRQGVASQIVPFCVNQAKAEGFQAIRVDIIPTIILARKLLSKTDLRMSKTWIWRSRSQIHWLSVYMS